MAFRGLWQGDGFIRKTETITIKSKQLHYEKDSINQRNRTDIGSRCSDHRNSNLFSRKLFDPLIKRCLLSDAYQYFYCLLYGIQSQQSRRSALPSRDDDGRTEQAGGGSEIISSSVGESNQQL